jgi:hypothetical protein
MSLGEVKPMPKKSSHKHPLAHSKGRHGFGSRSGAPSSKASWPFPAAASVAAQKQIAEQAKKAVKETAQAKEAVKKVSKTAAKAVKAASDKWAEQMKKRDEELKKLRSELQHRTTAIELGNIGRGLRKMSGSMLPEERERLRRERIRTSHARRGMTKAHQAAMKKQQAEAKKATELLAQRLKNLQSAKAKAPKASHKPGRPASMGGLSVPPPRPSAVPAKKSGGKRKKAGRRPSHAPKAPKGMRMAPGDRAPIRMRGAEPSVDASTIIRKGMKMGRVTKGGQVKQWQFWECAGPVRTGCGHSGSFVVGDGVSRAAIRVRGEQPYPTV